MNYNYLIYKEDVVDLAQISYEYAKNNVPNFNGASAPPGWFLEIIENNIKGYLNIVFTSYNDWVVFPTVFPSFSAIVYKKPNDSVHEISPEKIVMKYFTYNDFFKNSDLVYKIIKKMALNYLKQKKLDGDPTDLIILENSDIKVYIFKKIDLPQYLLDFGYPEDEVSRMMDRDAEEVDFDLIYKQLGA